MGTKTGIAWTDYTWNPLAICKQISPGCANCYAKTLHDRRHKAYLAGKKVPPQYAKPFEELQLFHDRLELPLHWREPRRIFVNSMSDLFHQDVPAWFIDEVFNTMWHAHWHIFQVLTKRPERMRDYMKDRWFLANQTPDNVWLGTSTENQHFLEERVPILLDTPAAVRFLSVEPLLGEIDLASVLRCGECRGHGGASVVEADEFGARKMRWQVCAVCGGSGYRSGLLHWVIVGGESGPGYRPMKADWARRLRDDCLWLGIPFFYKQGSGIRPGMDPVLDDIEYHQFPAAVHALQSRELADGRASAHVRAALRAAGEVTA
jgi:protein gp37